MSKDAGWVKKLWHWVLRWFGKKVEEETGAPE